MNVAFYDLRRKCFLNHEIVDMNLDQARQYGAELTEAYSEMVSTELIPASVWCAWRDDTSRYIGIYLLDSEAPELSKNTLDDIERLATQLSISGKRTSVH